MQLADENISAFEHTSDFKQVQKQTDDADYVIPSTRRWHERVAAQQSPRLNLKERAENFFSSGRNYLGNVFATSGCTSRLDWSLIRVEEPSGAVETQSRSTTFEDDRLQSPPGRVLNTHERLYKIGRTTGLSEGKYYGLFSVLLLAQPKDPAGNTIYEETYEHAIVGDSGKLFSESGDSGAFIFNVSCSLFGMLFAGNSGTQATYFMPYQSLFEAIKRITGVKDVRVPIE